jgi:Chaperone of endosialidase
MNNSSEAILALKPVTFRYKPELDPDGVPQFGLIAEQGEKVNPDLVVRDEDGKVTTVRYEAVNAMPLNEFLKEHRRSRNSKTQLAN